VAQLAVLFWPLFCSRIVEALLTQLPDEMRLWGRESFDFINRHDDVRQLLQQYARSPAFSSYIPRLTEVLSSIEPQEIPTLPEGIKLYRAHAVGHDLWRSLEHGPSSWTSTT